jgi:hypothetical protein
MISRVVALDPQRGLGNQIGVDRYSRSAGHVATRVCRLQTTETRRPLNRSNGATRIEPEGLTNNLGFWTRPSPSAEHTRPVILQIVFQDVHRVAVQEVDEAAPARP